MVGTLGYIDPAIENTGLAQIALQESCELADAVCQPQAWLQSAPTCSHTASPFARLSAAMCLLLLQRDLRQNEIRGTSGR